MNTEKHKHNSHTNSPFNSRLMKLVDIRQISKDNSSLVPESEGQTSALLWIHGIIVALGCVCVVCGGRVGVELKINKWNSISNVDH